jgi:hypothetical protein
MPHLTSGDGMRHGIWLQKLTRMDFMGFRVRKLIAVCGEKPLLNTKLLRFAATFGKLANKHCLKINTKR